MPRPVNPVGPRRMDERAYEKALRRIVLVPLMTRLRDGLSQAAAASMALDVINRITWDRGLMERLVEAEVAAHSARLSGYHKARLIQTFKAALAIDIRPQLSDSAIQPLMDAWRRENIGLIRTIPQRFHESLYQRVSETFTERPFDQQALIEAAQSRVPHRRVQPAAVDTRSDQQGHRTAHPDEAPAARDHRVQVADGAG